MIVQVGINAVLKAAAKRIALIDAVAGDDAAAIVTCVVLRPLFDVDAIAEMVDFLDFISSMIDFFDLVGDSVTAGDSAFKRVVWLCFDHVVINGVLYLITHRIQLL